MENEFLLECTFNSLINKNTYSFFKSCNNLYLESYIKKNFFQILKKKIIKIINKIKFNLKRIFIINNQNNNNISYDNKSNKCREYKKIFNNHLNKFRKLFKTKDFFD